MRPFADDSGEPFALALRAGSNVPVELSLGVWRLAFGDFAAK